MAFNTTGQTYTPAELTEQEREDWHSEMGVAKTGGDSSQDFSTLTLRAYNDQLPSEWIYIQHGCIGNWDGTQSIPLPLNAPKTILSKPNGNFQAISFTPFTGCHTAPYKGEDLKPYTLVRLKQNGFLDEKQPNWEVLPAIKGDKGIFGVVYGLEEEPIYKQVKTPTPKQKQVGVKKQWIIAALGDMPIHVCNENGNIEYGDRLTPSSIQGVAMKSTDLLDPFCGIAGMDVNFKDENDIVKIGITKE